MSEYIINECKGVLEPIEVTSLFKKKLVSLYMTNDNFPKINDLIIMDATYDKISPIYIYTECETTKDGETYISRGMSRLVYNKHPLFYVSGSDYLVYSPEVDTVGLKIFGQNVPVEINRDYIKVNEFKPVEKPEIILEGKRLEDIVDCSDMTTPYNMRDIVEKICLFLEACGRPVEHREFSPNHIKIGIKKK